LSSFEAEKVKTESLLKANKKKLSNLKDKLIQKDEELK